MSIQKLDASGNFLWAKSFGGSFTDEGQSIAVDAVGNVYTTGRFANTVDFDPGVGTANLTSAGTGNFDVFVQKLDASGNFLWARSFGGNEFDHGNSISVDASGQGIYTTGFFNGIADFDPGVGTANLTSVGNQGVFVQKISQVVTRIGDTGNGIQLKAFPNPSKGLVQLTFEKALDNAEITLTDLQGKVIYATHLDAAANEQINIEGVSGIYFLSVKTGQGQSVIKLVKE